ncbi:helicase associated domain-containing protein [Mycolicibacterium aubagnense]|uniref:Helicase-associated domain-containing protein n=1 Tax=Mycolicibacterium aubagnense TaxID=319707 RepID=A0ABN5Z1D1_9MYCO|nr:helicase associated domain-containing protein [Mycolicibacterium aubagnense]TLH64250.1 helicase [Mycolicibacterium aubagnense]BBX87890.1 hypothetical protein MAUB_57630 [Mycolicibacterium aubagnense]
MTAARTTDDEWFAHAAELSRNGCEPEPDSAQYSWLVWALWSRRAGLLSPEQQAALTRLPPAAIAVADQPWTLRFFACAARDRAGLALGGGKRTAWLTAQRRAHARGAMPAGRARLLENLAGFSWTPGADRWYSTLAQVRQHADRTGALPTRADAPELSGWLAAQRFALRSGRLDVSRASALEVLPGWNGSMSRTMTRHVWEQQLSALRTFVAAQRRYPDAGSSDSAEAELARWISVQRDLYRRGDLSSIRIQLIASLPGWRWNARAASFDARCAQLRRELAGGPIGTGHWLYSWVVSQRRRYRAGRMPDEQAAQLRSLNLLEDGLATCAA